MYTQKKRLTLSPKEVEAEYGFLVGTLCGRLNSPGLVQVRPVTGSPRNV
jgi:hypothetical protein